MPLPEYALPGPCLFDVLQAVRGPPAVHQVDVRQHEETEDGLEKREEMISIIVSETW